MNHIQNDSDLYVIDLNKNLIQIKQLVYGNRLFEFLNPETFQFQYDNEYNYYYINNLDYDCSTSGNTINELFYYLKQRFSESYDSTNITNSEIIRKNNYFNKVSYEQVKCNFLQNIKVSQLKPFTKSSDIILNIISTNKNDDYGKAISCEIMAQMLWNTSPEHFAPMSLMSVLEKINDLCILLKIDTSDLLDNIEGLLDAIKNKIKTLQIQ